MSAIHTGDLRAEGLNGIETVLEFRMEEMPGAHSTAMVACRVDTGKAAGLPGESVRDRTITIYRAGADRPVYSGMIRRGSVTEENGVQTMRLELISGTIRMDLAKRDRSWQDTGMSYGALFCQVAARAGAGVLYPSYLDSRPLGTPRVQYQETDWEFLKRMASHFSLPLYPEPTGGEARVFVGIPETGAPVELEWTEYTAVVEGSSHDRGRLLSYEVESREVHACGERTAFQGRELTICGRTCESRKGELIFTYRLARPEWALQKRLSNEKLSGLSLLGTVLSREEETLRLKLDIDRDHPDQNQGNEYPFPWRPATGNLMYLMPSKGSRVSLYFKNGDESSATAVNCIRQEGEGAENEYRKRSLRTEHQKELKLYPDRMGVISPDAHVLLDDLEGLSVRGRKSLRILSAGKISVSGQTVTLNTGKGKLSVYHGHAEAEKDGTVVFVKDAEFHHKEDGTKADSLGDRTCLCAYEKEDYSGNEYRFRDDPVGENYDYTGLAVQVMGGLVIVGGVTLVSGGVAAAVGAGVTMIMGATAVGGTTFVAGLAVTDLISRRVSSTEEYMKAALAGSVVGALTGAAELVPASGLARVGVDFLAGASGSAAGQLITEGEVDAERMFREGVLAAVMAAGARMLRGGNKGGTANENRTGRTKYDDIIIDQLKADNPEYFNEIVKDIRKNGGSPIEIPEDASINAKSMAKGYQQIKYHWTDGKYKYEARWHTETPGAVQYDRGTTWVITRTIPGNAQGQQRVTEYLLSDQWIDESVWKAAERANMSGTATPEQMKILEDGHWQAK